MSDRELSDAYAAAVCGQPIWVDPGQTEVTDEVERSTKVKSQGTKRKHKFQMWNYDTACIF